MTKVAEIKKQMEYYLGDNNLAKDDFFRDKILEDKANGYIDLSVFQKCNNIKKLAISDKDIAEACADSTIVEISKDKKQIRRKDNKALPEKKGSMKKRDAKASAKKEDSKVEAEPVDEPVQRDEQGRILFQVQDFENTLIVHFATQDRDEKKDEDYKVSWKSFETMIREKYDRLKVVYTRADKYEGDIAISSHKLNKAQFEQLVAMKDVDIDGKKFDLSETKGEVLKDFWQAQGNHFHFCIAPKLRAARKNQRKVQELKREEKVKKQKISYTIAGIHYMDINKVKSKSRAILNMKRDGEKLDQADEDFIKEILKHHHAHDAKMKDFANFEVGPHPEFNKTRCFFVVRSDGSKEDFSVSKCIGNLEQATQGDDE
jgi:hypothetical protein